jgi:hypothetical protein
MCTPTRRGPHHVAEGVFGRPIYVRQVDRRLVGT